MSLRISLHDDEGGVQLSLAQASVRQPQSAYRHRLAFADSNDDQSPAMLLYLPDEPEIGQRFRYGEAEWEIVDYRDGWVARLVV